MISSTRNSTIGGINPHFMNKKLQETCVSHLTQPGSFQIKKEFDREFEVLGLWVAADGDQLKNKFELKICFHRGEIDS